jgi:aspartate aminotransferase
VIVGPGSKELMFLMQLVYYGDIVIPTPAWVSYAPQAQIIGRHIHFVTTREQDEWRFTPRQLEALCHLDPGRPLIVVLNYPSNPTGGTYTEQELEALAEVASRNRVVLLSDEIYGKLHHNGAHRSIAPIYPQGTILSGGLSKWCGAGGWRLGLFVVPSRMRWLLNAMAVAASETYTSTSAPIQYAAVRAFQGGPEIEQYLLHCRRVLKALGQLLASRLRASGLKVLAPAGGFYLFPNFSPLRGSLLQRGIATSRDLCAHLLEDTGVACLPGADFGRSPGELTVRLSYVDFDGAEALAAARQMPDPEPLGEEFVQRWCAPTVEAIDRICRWLRESGSEERMSATEPASG